MEKLRLFSLGSNDTLAKGIADYLSLSLSSIRSKRFSDGEPDVEILENVRGTHVMFVQSTNQPDGNLMQLLVAIDAARRADVREVTAVIPYFGYARQDRRAHSKRTAITAKLVARLLESAGASRILTMDLHANQIEGFFNIPVNHLYARPVFVAFCKHRYADELRNGKLMFASTDQGGLERTVAYAERTIPDDGVAPISKSRDRNNNIERMRLFADVRGKRVVMTDDIADSGGTLVRAAKVLMDAGAAAVDAVVPHAVCSGEAYSLIDKSPIETVYVSDTIGKQHQSKKVHVVSMAHHFGEGIRRMVAGSSLSELSR